jgi:polysaccharide export outer membrane protein
MTTARMSRTLHYLGQLASQQFDRRNDADLFDRFRLGDDQGAFEALLHRHGAMVFGVCRRILDDEHAAQDAFQTTFLVLIRKADCFAPGSCLGPWLYGVARRTALKARSAIVRRKRIERQAGLARSTAACDPDTGRELAWLLDEELGRLPEKYRDPLVLCLLEGKSRKEASALLGWREGTLSGRLARAKELLAARLSRRGLTSAAILACLAESAAARVPLPLTAATANAALTLVGEAATPGLVSISTLMEVVKVMFTSKLKTALGVLVLAAGIGLGTAAVAWQPNDASEYPTKASPAKLLSASPKQAKASEYVIEPPDVLLVQYSRPELTDPVRISGACLVRPDGTIGLGILGRVFVSGKTIDQAREAIACHLKARLDGFDSAKLTVEVKESNSKFCYIVVKDARAAEQVYRFPIRPDKTVLDAIAAVHEIRPILLGLGKKRIRLQRKTDNGEGKVILGVNWAAISRDGESSTN